MFKEKIDKQWIRLQKQILEYQKKAIHISNLIGQYKEQAIMHLKQMPQELLQTEILTNSILLRPIQEALKKIPWTLTKDRLPTPSVEIWYEITRRGIPKPQIARFLSEYPGAEGYFSVNDHLFYKEDVIAWRPYLSEIYEEKEKE